MCNLHVSLWRLHRYRRRCESVEACITAASISLFLCSLCVICDRCGRSFVSITFVCSRSTFFFAFLSFVWHNFGFKPHHFQLFLFLFLALFGRFLPKHFLFLFSIIICQIRWVWIDRKAFRIAKWLKFSALPHHSLQTERPTKKSGEETKRMRINFYCRHFIHLSFPICC